MRQIAILSTLLALSLAGSYLTAFEKSEDESASDKVIVLRATADDLGAVSWIDDKTTARLTRPKDKGGPYFWLDVIERKEEKAKPPEAPTDPLADPTATPPAPAEAAPTVTETKAKFLGSEAAEEVWTGFSPLYALRELPVGADADLSAYGLDAPKATLEIEHAGKTLKLDVGGESYGTKDRYVKLEGKIYLIDDKILRPLQYARTRMVERRLYPLEDKKIERITIAQGDSTRTFVQKNADDPAKSYYADKGTPDQKDIEGTTWIGKIGRIRTQEFVDESTLASPLETVFKFTIEGSGESWPVEILRTGSGADTTYYARAAYTRALVQLTRTLVQEPVDDLAGLFDADHGTEEPEEAAPASPRPSAHPMPPGGPPMPPMAPPGAPGGSPH